MMADEKKVVSRDGQWLASGDVFADYGDEEVMVALDGEVVEHPLIGGLPDNEHGQSVQSPREAIKRASEAATRAQARGNVDGDRRILVTVEDLAEDE